MVTRGRSLSVLSVFAAIQVARPRAPAAQGPLAGPLPLGSDAGATPTSESFGEGQDIVPSGRPAAADALAGDGSEVVARCHWGPVPTSPAWESIVAALGSAREVFVPCTGDSCRPDRPPCERWDIAFLPPDESGAPELEIRRAESHPDGSWQAEAYELSPFGYPCNDGIDVLCVQHEGCGPALAVGIGVCSSGCPSMERYHVRSSRPGVVEFEWYERTSDEGVIEFGTKTFYSSLQDCLAASSAAEVRLTPSATAPDVRLTAVWGSGPTDVWVSGFDCTLLHFDGTAWERHDLGTTAWIESLGGTGPDDVCAGARGPSLHCGDGNSWARVELPVDEYFEVSDIEAGDGGDLFIASTLRRVALPVGRLDPPRRVQLSVGSGELDMKNRWIVGLLVVSA